MGRQGFNFFYLLDVCILSTLVPFRIVSYVTHSFISIISIIVDIDIIDIIAKEKRKRKKGKPSSEFPFPIVSYGILCNAFFIDIIIGEKGKEKGKRGKVEVLDLGGGFVSNFVMCMCVCMGGCMGGCMGVCTFSPSARLREKDERWKVPISKGLLL